MEIQKLIKEKKLDSFEKIRDYVKRAPFHIQVKEKNTLYLLQYNQIKTNFSYPFTRECRGIILEKETNRVVCYPFDKFFNHSEKFADLLDLDSTVYYEKIDGSLIKLFFYGDEWRIASNGCIDARDATLHGGVSGRSFMDLFNECKNKNQIIWDTLDRKYTYMLELCHPDSSIVVQHLTPMLYHIGTRNNITFKEYSPCGVYDGMPAAPKSFQFASIQDVLDNLKNLDVAAGGEGNITGDDPEGPDGGLWPKSIQHEGYVAVDSSFHRNKFKSKLYISLHYLKGRKKTQDFYLDLVINNEASEFLAYTDDPADPVAISAITARISSIAESISLHINERPRLSRKEFAIKYKGLVYFSVMMNFYDVPETSVESICAYILELPRAQLSRLVLSVT